MVPSDPSSSDAGCVYVNGVYSAPREARVSAFDRGVLYGDGVFDSLRTYGGVPFRLDAHLTRLAEGLAAVGFRRTPERGELEAIVAETLKRSGLPEAYVRITITRGEDLGGPLPPPDLAPTVIVAARPLRLLDPALYAEGGRAVILWTRGLEDEPGPGIKSSSYQRGVLGRLRVAERRAAEGFYLDGRGNVTEGTVSNLFVVRAGELWTPPREVCLAGVTRAEVLALAAREGIRCVEAPVPLDALHAADEAFMTSSLAELLPIVEVEGRPIGDRRPGLLTRRLLEAYRAETRR